MSDDEGGGKKGGRKGKDRRGEGGGGGGSGGGGKKGRDGGGKGNGVSVSRMKVVPKFIQEMQARLKPSEAKRGLEHARLDDKQGPMGRNDDDEYDFEDAQIVDSNLTAEEVATFRKRKTEAAKPRTFFATEAARPQEEEGEKGQMKFRGKTDRAISDSAGRDSAKATVSTGRRVKVGSEGDARTQASAKPPSAKRQRLSFDDDDDG
mmetsp:Transcript_127476/g.224560  ORF Transcript_127476/g.224560 Transcript_127476/m.224560 type:complete len:206 (+) Transcript_127476:108-725(+)